MLTVLLMGMKTRSRPDTTQHLSITIDATGGVANRAAATLRDSRLGLTPPTPLLAYLEHCMTLKRETYVSKAHYWCLIVPTTTNVSDALNALADYAKPAIEHSQVPEQMWAWVTRTDNWIVCFHESLPHMASWVDGEHHQEPMDLDAYFLVIHNNQGQFDELISRTDSDFLDWQYVDGESWFQGLPPNEEGFLPKGLPSSGLKGKHRPDSAGPRNSDGFGRTRVDCR